MSAYFRKCVSLAILAGLGLLGCDDGTTDLSEESGEVRAKAQKALVGEGCVSNTDCDDPCYTDETCDVGVSNLCIATTAAASGTSCDADGEACTTDQCDGAGACVFNSNNTDACDDGDPCTVGDVCGGGTCTAGASPLDCDDGVACTDDTCTPGVGCNNAVNNSNCDDGVSCTDDVCDAVTNCSNTVNDGNCDDGVGCTTDVCDAITDCSNTTNDAACDDGVSCTTDTCDATLDCQNATVDSACDDGVSCTDDVCDAVTDCSNAVNNGNCDDGVGCTDDVCDAVTDCENTVNDGNCDDGVACTIDACDAVTDCSNTANDAACDDTNDCTTDTCDVVLGCQNPDTVTPTCDDTNSCTDDSCNPSNGNCVNTANIANSCTDGVGCTTDTCQPNGSCQSSANNAACNDGVGCTIDACDPVTDCSNTPADNLCGDGVGCTTDTCHPTLDCQNAPNNAACDDGVSCTDDVCDAVTDCSNTANNGNCDDGVGCTVDVCDAVTDCENTTNDAACDDGVGCTVDVCDAVTDCENTTNDAACDDGVGCTDDVCDAVTDCSSTANDGNCDDSEACTDDSCDAVLDCQFVGNSDVCDDADPCTVGDVCSGGTCTAGATPLPCSDTNPCTDDVCTPGLGCEFPNDNTNTCSDGFDCTENDSCLNGSCQPGTPNNALCTRDRECAVDRCVINQGCQLDADGFAGVTCRAEAAGSLCDNAESCDGVNVDCPPDAFKVSGTVCVAASCGNGEQYNEVACTGATSTCPAQVPIDCDGHLCDGLDPNQCQSTCSTNADCLGTHFCSGGDCLPRAGAGQPCTANDNCAQGDSCVDDVCCNTTCTGQCEACNVAGSVGTCTPIPAGDAPQPGGATGAQRSACNTDGSSCGGTCDGSNVSSCAFPAMGTICAPPDCTNEQAVEASICNGLGACNAPNPVDCDPFVCDAAGEACRGDCTLDSHCAAGLQCNAGVCVEAFSDGADCTLGTQCESGNCVDGVCCESACTGQCEACGESGTKGECVPVTGAPVGSRPDCPGTGDCAGACNGTNPSACTFPSTDTECREAGCDSGIAIITAYCDGAGSCPRRQTVDCPDGCDGALCDNAECTLRSDCPDGETCQAGICVAQADDGAACSLDGDCGSGNCVDGYCCDSACGGQCEACDVSGNLGVCTAVPSGDQPHGGRQACASDGSVCGGSCDGTATDSCDYPTSGECRPGNCSGGVAIVAATCDGSGECPLLQEQDCGGISCSATGDLCDGACAADPDACGAGEYCSAGICVQLVDNGNACAADDQCTSGLCVDGFCCNSECAQQCAACDVPGSEGTCSPVEGSVHGPRAACEGRGACGSQCDGEDVSGCGFPGADTSCGAGTCANGVETDEAFCDGEGRCAESSSSACDSLRCEGNQCASGCETDADCQGDLICEENACVEDPLINAVDKGSCGCRVPGDKPPAGGLPWLLIAPLSLLALRRRGGRAAPSALRSLR